MFRKKRAKDKKVELEKLDKQEILNDIRKYFAEVTPEQFLEDVKRACPELLWDESAFSPTDFSRAVKKPKGTKPNCKTNLQA
jgi:hypothetical protein